MACYKSGSLYLFGTLCGASPHAEGMHFGVAGESAKKDPVVSRKLLLSRRLRVAAEKAIILVGYFNRHRKLLPRKLLLCHSE
jgi:hypothetical protein